MLFWVLWLTPVEEGLIVLLIISYNTLVFIIFVVWFWFLFGFFFNQMAWLRSLV